jgi:hypothetical protein
MTASSAVPADTTIPTSPDYGGFPFACELSLVPLITAWQEPAGAGQPLRAAIDRALNDIVAAQLRQAPELLAPIRDLAAIGRHRELVDVLMLLAFPPAFWDRDFGAAVVPFRLKTFYATPSFERLLMAEDGTLRGRVNVDMSEITSLRIMHAYAAILERFYDTRLDFEFPLLVTVEDPDSRLDRHFRLTIDRRFLDIEAVGPLPALPEPDRQRLLASLADTALLQRLLPPHLFRFRGFTVFRAVDVTDQEVLSALKRDLIEKESIVSSARFASLQDKLRTFFRRPALHFGLAAIQDDQVFMLSAGTEVEYGCIFADSAHYCVEEFAGSVYDRAIAQGRPLLVEDLATAPGRTAIEETLLNKGVRTLVAAPLYYQDQLIGMLNLDSPVPGDLNATHAVRLRDILPLFSMAVRRSLEELNIRVEAVIKEKCTAIHPSVEWRFRRAVLESFDQARAGAPVEMPPIVFSDVHPLFGVSDLRGSSTQRNLAIQADLIEHLTLARNVVRRAHGARRLPILDELAYRIGKHLGEIELNIQSGDEMTVLTFLRDRVEPLFDHLAAFGDDVRECVAAYRAALDARFGTVYQQRRSFDESVALVNDTISAYLDAEEQQAQAMFPHYFEKQKTDGVDHSIYVGAALVEDGAFNVLYLRNLRLWQLMVICGIARQAERLREKLPVPMETTHLVLVQNQPLSLRFRFDEKRFDVDGAYNMRYELIKKRIDKAVVKGTAERVTQPGMIAIIYSQAREALEYREYLDYLQATGYLTPGVEELELEDLQGVQGLRALRVAVSMNDPAGARPVALAEVEAAVRSMGPVGAPSGDGHE